MGWEADHPVVPLFHVCKQWNVLVAPLIYRHLCVSGFNCAEKLSLALDDGTKRGILVNPAVRSLDVNPPVSSTTHALDILKKCSHLHTFDARPASPSDLRWLESLAMPGGTLRILHVHLCFGSGWDGESLISIGRLLTLNRLYVVVMPLNHMDATQFPAVDPWMLPDLVHLSVMCTKDGPGHGAFTKFIEQCHFPSLRSVRLL
ncbi:hypothetical protein DACRYDRAFT_23658, partial [Dacryopinax primogenitus]